MKVGTIRRAPGKVMTAIVLIPIADSPIRGV
jgi:hypothetical protein